MNALLVIDVQKGYMEGYKAELLTLVNERILEAKKTGELIVYVMNVRRQKGERVVNEPANGLLVLSENFVYKERASVFSDEEFVLFLERNSVSEIEFIGIDGCCCVASSAIAARERGLKAGLCCRYIGVKTEARFEKKKALLKKAGVTVTE